jgi:hypothetical protein
MAKTKKEDPYDGRWVKVSLLFEPELNRDIMAIAERSGLDRTSVIRKILKDHLHEYQTNEPLQTVLGEEDMSTITVHLQDEQLKAAMALAVKLHNLTPRAICQLLVAEGMAPFLEKGQAKAKALKDSLAKFQS